MTTVAVHTGESPLVLAMPHGSTAFPDDIWNNLNENGRGMADTDWHIERLYDGLCPEASVVVAGFHRYVIDANRDPEGTSLYPGQNTTTLVPRTDFDNQPIWRNEEGSDDVEHRLDAYFWPYHHALKAELERVRARHGVAILYDCHSIRSRVPFLFDGQLPALNIGTASGTSCDQRVAETVADICVRSQFDTVLNGRFRGGWTTRHYGRPEFGIHAIQMEISQRCYMQEAPPWSWREPAATSLRFVLREILQALVALAPRLKGET